MVLTYRQPVGGLHRRFDATTYAYLGLFDAEGAPVATGSSLSAVQIAAGALIDGIVNRSAAQLSTTPLAVDVAAKDTLLIKGPTGQVYYVLPDGSGYCAVGDGQGGVTPEQLGAVGDGATDDSAAWTLACSGVFRRVRMRPGGNYVIGDVPVANGVRIVGVAGRDYTTFHSYIQSRFTRKSGCAVVFLLDNHGNANIGRSVTMEGFAIDGVDKTCHGISAGSVRLTIRDVGITNCNFGIGGGASGGWAYSNTMSAWNVLVTECTRAISSPIDSRFFGCELADNGDNLRAVAGANSNQFIGGRIEFASSGNNIKLDASGSGSTISYWRFVGVELDRGVGCAAYLNTATYISFIGCMFRRSGSGAGGLGARSHVYVDGCDRISITDPQTSHGHDDGGGGSETPAYFFEANNVNSNVVITGGDISGSYVTAALHYNSGLNTTQMPGHKITGVGGVEDYDNSSLRWKDAGREMFGLAPHTGTLSTSVAATITGLRTPGPGGNDARGYKLKVWTRNASSSLRNLTAEFSFQVRKDAGTATVVNALYGGNEQGVKGAIGWNGSTSISSTMRAGGTTLTGVLNAGASATDDAYIGWTFTATGGTNSGWSGVCLGYLGSTNQIAHFHKPAAAAFDATTTFTGKVGSQIQIAAAANVLQGADGSVTFDLTFTNIGADTQDIWAEVVQ